MNRFFLLLALVLVPVAGRTQSTRNDKVATVSDAGTALGASSLDGVLLVDGDKYAGRPDLGSTLNLMISQMPRKTVNGTSYPVGFIVIPQGDYVLSTTVTTGPFVSIEGVGVEQVRIKSMVDGDAFDIRDEPFNNNRGAAIGGFTLVGPGSRRPNAIGIHTGDLNFARLHDLAIGGFTGGNASCFWVDNRKGWFERNMIENISLGEVETTTGNQNLGCAKSIKFTAAGGATTSFGYDEWIGIRMSPQGAGQTGWSIESGLLYSNVIIGSANITQGNTLFAVSTAAGGWDNFVDFRAENTAQKGAATGWSVAKGSDFSYLGPGIVTGRDAHINNSISGSLTPYLTSQDLLAGPGIAAGGRALYVPTRFAPAGQINESISLGDGPANWGSGFGGVQGNNIAHPIVWGYGQDANCFEIYKKDYQKPLTAANRIATFPCAAGGPSATLTYTVSSGVALLSSSTISPGECGLPIRVAANGVSNTDSVAWAYGSAPAMPDALLKVNVWVTNDHVNFNQCNPTSRPIVPVKVILNWRVTR